MAKRPTNTITKQQMEIIPSTLTEEAIRHRIYTIRGVQVMIDRDLAEMYGVETGQLNRQVKRNADRFPEDFMFQLTKEDVESLKCQFGISNIAESLKCQNGISNGRGGVRYLPYAFTEEGVSTLATVLHSAQAAQTHIKIMRAFVAMRRFIAQNAGVFQRIDQIEKHLILTDSKLEDTNIRIDHVLDKTKIMESAFHTYQKQYPTEHVELHVFNKSHDRWLIIDNEVYHFGASIKDLGKKWFEVSQITEYTANELIAKLTNNN